MRHKEQYHGSEVKQQKTISSSSRNIRDITAYNHLCRGAVLQHFCSLSDAITSIITLDPAMCRVFVCLTCIQVTTYLLNMRVNKFAIAGWSKPSPL